MIEKISYALYKKIVYKNQALKYTIVSYNI